MLSDGNAINKDLSAEKSFRIKQDDRFFSRLMTKETSMANGSSSGVFYYGETSLAVPFRWEAQPGTPKHPLSETSPPPLTPPPSYHFNSKSKTKRRNSKANIFSIILPRLVGSRKDHVSPSSSWSRSSSSSSSSSRSLAYYSPSVSMRNKDQGSSSLRSSTSTVGSSMKHGFRCCYPFGNMKNKPWSCLIN